MHNYVGIVMNDKKHAYAALRALWELDSAGLVTVHGSAVAHKNAWGLVEVDTKETLPALATAVGVGIGAIIGLLAGPAGAVVGAAGGAVIGASIGGAVGLGTDMLRATARDQAGFETSLVMAPGQSAVIADVSEGSTWSIDTRMRELGGVVHRRSSSALRRDWEDDDFMYGSYSALYPYEYVPAIDPRLAYTTRDHVLGLLSDEEVARVSTAETAAGLVAGDEYLDLEELERGVLRAPGPGTPMGRVLPRKAVAGPTWRRILAELGASHPAAPPTRP